MSKAVRLAGISGSLRNGSYNTMLLREIGTLLPENTTLDILSIDSIPAYNADHDLPAADKRPEAVQAFMDALAKADGLVIVSPEYNYSIPGALKNAIDWASRGSDSPLLRKPVAVMGVTQGLWGTLRMQLAFHAIFTYLDMKPVYKPEILIAGGADKFDARGKLTDVKTKELVKQKIANLHKIIVTGTY